jgi:hypothetical protein
MQIGLSSLRAMDLQAFEYPLSSLAKPRKNGLAPLDRNLLEVENLLPSWSNNLSSQYFSHARTLPINVG